jgi:RNA polymerase sigma factor (sigma-70 family)
MQGGEEHLEGLTDQELIELCLKGQKDAFSEIVTRYKKLIFSVVYNFINDKEEVSDIAQEVFIRIYKSLHRYNPEYKFSTWSVKIATNLCLDVLRKKRINSASIEEIESIARGNNTPEEDYIKEERNKMVRDAIAQLPEKYRILIIMFHQNGLSYEEISRTLNEPMTIIKNRLYRARIMLRKKLEPYRREEIL